MIQSVSVSASLGRVRSPLLIGLLLIGLLLNVSGCKKRGADEAIQTAAGEASMEDAPPEDAPVGDAPKRDESGLPSFESLFGEVALTDRVTKLSPAQQRTLHGHWLIDVESKELPAEQRAELLTGALAFGFVFEGEDAATMHIAAEGMHDEVGARYTVIHAKDDTFILTVNADDRADLGMDYILLHFPSPDTMRLSAIIGPRFDDEEPVLGMKRATESAFNAAMDQ